MTVNYIFPVVNWPRLSRVSRFPPYCAPYSHRISVEETRKYSYLFGLIECGYTFYFPKLWGDFASPSFPSPELRVGDSTILSSWASTRSSSPEPQRSDILGIMMTVHV